ncbi:UvrD-helicase domain-containing protein [Anaeromyxobacter oryzisoli]|uniref:UvrD-helicase domain-containing protein n=1 Tax=Anaeromyxobacter oryzisoli TaxID=2925408 RepID=UPI001F586AB5|nr:UvrD-helicase domain-containing protein [Anaeromyxobacter sp. SG63]
MIEGSNRLLTLKPAFLAQWMTLDGKDNRLVQAKLDLLLKDPVADQKTKKRLQHFDGKIHRIRAGDYRIFYVFDEKYVSVLGLDRKDDDTYDAVPASDFLGGLDYQSPAPAEPQNRARKVDKASSKPSGTPLPRPVTKGILEALKVDAKHHRALVGIATEEELFGCESVPEEIRLLVSEALTNRPLEVAGRQPDLVVANPDDLFRYQEGELLGFLLKLDPDQERFVSWALNSKGPTLVKGAPGTGKSTVALYRVKAILDRLLANGVEKPRVLFTTYTNALVSVSEQLLEQLLGDRASLIEVRTADSLVTLIASRAGHKMAIASGEEQLHALAMARQKVELGGNKVEQAAQAQALSRLAPEYMLEELNGVIDARGIDTLEVYLAAARPGRKLALGPLQRKAVWALRTTWNSELAASGKRTFSQTRMKAAEVVAEGKGPPPYDAVVVDEAQDLDPVVLGMLVRLCAEPNRLFLTADADQSIYGSGFRWSDVHASLKFQGRTGILRRNHRSTARIGKAARSYLGGGALDEDKPEEVYVHEGDHPPVVARASEPDSEARLLARFCRAAAKELHLTLGSCAILAPSRDCGRAIAERLKNLGVSATFMDSKSLDLRQPGVKVITLQAAKGLEFPAVALAGFGESTFPSLKPDSSLEARLEALARARRTVFVGMTRAMRLLLVTTPGGDNPVLEGFDPALWHEVKAGQGGN